MREPRVFESRLSDLSITVYPRDPSDDVMVTELPDLPYASYIETFIGDYGTHIYDNKRTACYHEKIERTVTPAVMDVGFLADGYEHTTYRVVPPVYDDSWRVNVNAILAQNVVSYTPDWDAAIAGLLPEIESEFNGVNFLLEMGDLASLWNVCVRGFVRLIRLFRNMDVYDQLSRFSLGRTTQAVSDYWLTWTLAVRPIMADCDDMAKSAGRKSVEVWRKIQDMRKPKKFRKSVIFEHPISVETVTADIVGGNVEYTRVVKSKTVCTMSGTMVCDPSFSRLSLIYRMSEYRVDLSTIWNAVPFSFLVDYLIPIGRALATPATHELNPHLSNCMVSYTTEFKIEYIPMQCTSPENFWRLENGGSYKVEGSIYERLHAAPSIDGISLSFESPGASQVANVFALLFSALYSPRR